MLREAEAIAHLRFKQSLFESTCNAVLSIGVALPVFIQKLDTGETKFLVEQDDRFWEAEKLSTFVRFEIKPGELENQEPPVVKSTKLPGASWLEMRQASEAALRRARAERFASNQEQQGLSPNLDLERLAREENERVAARLKPKR